VCCSVLCTHSRILSGSLFAVSSRTTTHEHCIHQSCALQHTATHCNTRLHAATRCTATHCNTLQHPRVYKRALSYFTLRWTTTKKKLLSKECYSKQEQFCWSKEFCGRTEITSFLLQKRNFFRLKIPYV